MATKNEINNMTRAEIAGALRGKSLSAPERDALLRRKNELAVMREYVREADYDVRHAR